MRADSKVRKVMTSTKRASTRAVSAGGSPRPICELCRSHHEGVAAELEDGELERDPRAGGRFVEEQRGRFPRERSRMIGLFRAPRANLRDTSSSLSIPPGPRSESDRKSRFMAGLRRLRRPWCDVAK